MFKTAELEAEKQKLFTLNNQFSELQSNFETKKMELNEMISLLDSEKAINAQHSERISKFELEIDSNSNQISNLKSQLNEREQTINKNNSHIFELEVRNKLK